MTAKTNMTTDELIASMDKEALREVLVTLATVLCYDISDRARERAYYHLESAFEGAAAVLEADEAVMREANSLACELDAPGD